MTFSIGVPQATLLNKNSLHSHHKKKDSLSIDNIPNLQPASFCSGVSATRELGAEYLWRSQHRGKTLANIHEPSLLVLKKNLRQSGKIPTAKCEFLVTILKN